MCASFTPSHDIIQRRKIPDLPIISIPAQTTIFEQNPSTAMSWTSSAALMASSTISSDTRSLHDVLPHAQVIVLVADRHHRRCRLRPRHRIASHASLLRPPTHCLGRALHQLWQRASRPLASSFTINTRASTCSASSIPSSPQRFVYP